MRVSRISLLREEVLFSNAPGEKCVSPRSLKTIIYAYLGSKRSVLGARGISKIIKISRLAREQAHDNHLSHTPPCDLVLSRD